MPAGGSIVIDHTEALTAIDINSARATKGDDIEETALNTNLEAAEEIARQLRIRDLGGLIVIDFIDMGPNRNQRDVENKLREAVRQDRARIQIGRISRFGLLEMSRQRVRPSLGEATQPVCPRCNGVGNVRSVESLALAILRLVGEEARKERTSKIIVQLPIDVSNYILNEKRSWAQSIQDENDVAVVLIGNADLETPNYSVKRVRDDELDLAENKGTSYKLAEPKADPGEVFEVERKQAEPEQPAVSGVVPQSPAPKPLEQKPQQQRSRTKSWWQRLFGWLSPTPEKADPPAERRSRRGRGRSAKRGANRRPQSERGKRERGQNRGQNRSHSGGGGSRGSKQSRERGTDGNSGGSDSRGRRPRRRRGSGSGSGSGSGGTKAQGQNTGKTNAETKSGGRSADNQSDNRKERERNQPKSDRKNDTPKQAKATDEPTRKDEVRANPEPIIESQAGPQVEEKTPAAEPAQSRPAEEKTPATEPAQSTPAETAQSQAPDPAPATQPTPATELEKPGSD